METTKNDNKLVGFLKSLKGVVSAVYSDIDYNTLKNRGCNPADINEYHASQKEQRAVRQKQQRPLQK